MKPLSETNRAAAAEWNDPHQERVGYPATADEDPTQLEWRWNSGLPEKQHYADLVESCQAAGDYGALELLQGQVSEPRSHHRKGYLEPALRGLAERVQDHPDPAERAARSQAAAAAVCAPLRRRWEQHEFESARTGAAEPDDPVKPLQDFLRRTLAGETSASAAVGPLIDLARRLERPELRGYDASADPDYDPAADQPDPVPEKERQEQLREAIAGIEEMLLIIPAAAAGPLTRQRDAYRAELVS